MEILNAINHILIMILRHYILLQLLLEKKTGSAGEFVASCFLNSKKVKLFGEKSAGFFICK
jgi:hypothetical protein